MSYNIPKYHYIIIRIYSICYTHTQRIIYTILLYIYNLPKQASTKYLLTDSTRIPISIYCTASVV